MQSPAPSRRHPGCVTASHHRGHASTDTDPRRSTKTNMTKKKEKTSEERGRKKDGF